MANRRGRLLVAIGIVALIVVSGMMLKGTVERWLHGIKKEDVIGSLGGSVDRFTETASFISVTGSMRKTMTGPTSTYSSVDGFAQAMNEVSLFYADNSEAWARSRFA